MNTRHFITEALHHLDQAASTLRKEHIGRSGLALTPKPLYQVERAIEALRQIDIRKLEGE